MSDTGDALRDKGWVDVQAADAAVHRGHRHRIEVAVARLIRSGQPFHAEHVRQMLPDGARPHSANLLPSVLGCYAQARVIVPVGFTRTTRPTRHASRLTVWIGARPVDEAV